MQVLLEVAIGLVLTFAVMSVIVSSTMELISAAVRMRSHALEQGIARLLDDQKKPRRKGVAGRIGLHEPASPAPFTQAVIGHPLITSLSSARSANRPPSYIDSVTFTSALLETKFGEISSQIPSLYERIAGPAGDVRAGITEIKGLNQHLGSSLESLWNRAGGDVDKFRHEIEDWFDREMARVSGWYSRWSQWIMVAVALVLVGLLNVSAVTIGRALLVDPTLRSEVVRTAEKVDKSAAPPATGAASAPAVSTKTLDTLGLPIGWDAEAWPGVEWYLVLHILGMVVVAIAASFGAPFWFDLLNQLVNLRTSGKPPPTAAVQRAAADPS